MPPVGFEPTISTGKRPQTHPLDHAAIGTGESSMCVRVCVCVCVCAEIRCNVPEHPHVH
jgi:hypothetical protein